MTQTASRPSPIRGAIASLLLFAAAPASASEPLRVEFTADGRCVVRARHGSGRADLEYVRRGPELRCAIVGVESAAPVDLQVLLPPAAEPPARGEFPRLAWTREDERWTGRARLPAPPAFVSVPRPGERLVSAARVLDALGVLAMAAAVAWSLIYGRRGARP
jgi:hypothetical protein